MIGTLSMRQNFIQRYPSSWIENWPSVSKAGSKSSKMTSITKTPKSLNPVRITAEYFRVRDFEFVQPLYDLAFLLEIDALARRIEIPKYRTFSLWRAGYSLDGYGTSISRWLDGVISSEDLDHVPSLRIKQYLSNIQLTGTLPELDSYSDEHFARCLRLRSVRGLGPSAIAQTLSEGFVEDEWLRKTSIDRK